MALCGLRPRDTLTAHLEVPAGGRRAWPRGPGEVRRAPAHPLHPEGQRAVALPREPERRLQLRRTRVHDRLLLRARGRRLPGIRDDRLRLLDLLEDLVRLVPDERLLPRAELLRGPEAVVHVRVEGQHAPPLLVRLLRRRDRGGRA